MTPLAAFLDAARRRVHLRRALVWATRGTAVGAVGALAVLLADRRWPVESEAPWLALAAGLGVAVFLLGWRRARPTVAEVARMAHRSLGGRERLATALELADSATDGPLARRQQTDTEAWLISADPDKVAPWRVPRMAASTVAAAVGLAAILAVLPNPAQARATAERRASEATDQAADAVAAAAD